MRLTRQQIINSFQSGEFEKAIEGLIDCGAALQPIEIKSVMAHYKAGLTAALASDDTVAGLQIGLWLEHNTRFSTKWACRF